MDRLLTPPPQGPTEAPPNQQGGPPQQQQPPPHRYPYPYPPPAAGYYPPTSHPGEAHNGGAMGPYPGDYRPPMYYGQYHPAMGPYPGMRPHYPEHMEQWRYRPPYPAGPTYYGEQQIQRYPANAVQQSYNPTPQPRLQVSDQPIRAHYLVHVAGNQPITDQYFLIRSVLGCLKSTWITSPFSLGV